MSKPNAIDFATLVDWYEGRLSEEEANVVAEQITRADAATRKDLAWLQAFKQVSDATVLTSPPLDVHERLVQRFKAYTADRPQSGFLQRLVAVLTFDSGAQPAAAGARAASVQALPRQLIYTTAMAEVALNIQARSDGRSLDVFGQVFPSDAASPSDFTVQLLGGAAESAITAANDLGEFVFEALLPASYEMILSTSQFEILVTPIDLTG